MSQSVSQSVSQSINEKNERYKETSDGQAINCLIFLLPPNNFSFSHLNVLSFISRSFQIFIAISTVCGIINPFLAMCIAGLNSSFHGNLPYFFHAASKPRSSPGTATAKPPVNEDEKKNCGEKVLRV